MGKTSTGLEENVAGLLCYLAGWVTGLVFILLEPENKFVRFHAMQSIIVFGILTVASSVLWAIPFIGWIIAIFLGPVTFILWLVLMIKAYQGVKFKIPWAGDFAEKQVG
ncbi:hypothetical protein ES703_71206 [subsurface metagenome]